MIQLNLLPPQEKTEIVSHRARREILGLGVIGLMMVLIFLILLSTVWAYLLIQLRSMEAIISDLENSAQGRAARQYQNEVDSANKTLKNYSKLSSGIRDSSLWLEKLLALSRTGIGLSQVSFDGQDVKLLGHAETRDNLLAFRQALLESDSFENLDASLQNFLKQNDIDFFFSFQLKEGIIN